MSENREIIVVNTTLKKYEIVLSAILWTFLFTTLFYCIYLFCNYGFNKYSLTVFLGLIPVIAVFLLASINSCTIDTICLVKDENKLIHKQNVVFYKTQKTIDTGYFDYLAINRTLWGYTATIWYKNNGHYGLLSFNKYEDSFKYSKLICKELNIQLLDKTGKESIWTNPEDL